MKYLNNRNKYSIRKFTVGAASLIIGMMMMMYRFITFVTWVKCIIIRELLADDIFKFIVMCTTTFFI
ncbi:YSIRK-type signal peptide-containing protein [Macrococcus armenti]|uniref:YSIRK-type signal peptide-containing protein n=1 Tax=Macrococcus armenti TaxID=2875764 RepID=UPI001F4C661E|nr:YSIRK-type signal peptide-containing protein [Macrococcus armenti]